MPSEAHMALEKLYAGSCKSSYYYYDYEGEGIDTPSAEGVCQQDGCKAAKHQRVGHLVSSIPEKICRRVNWIGREGEPCEEPDDYERREIAQRTREEASEGDRHSMGGEK